MLMTLFVVWLHSKEELQKFQEHLNSAHPNIGFMIETEEGNSSLFLYVIANRKPDGSFGRTFYRKFTHTDLHRHASSHHHPSQKLQCSPHLSDYCDHM
jgi:hypothetical protein